MSELLRFTSVSFRNYKALRQYSVSLRGFNVLVGPNNSGKSTILGAFRILSEGIRKALARNAELINLRGEETWGYRVPLDDLPVSTENIFSDYDDSQPALVEFRLSNANKLQLVFPEQNACYLICKTVSRRARTVSDFRRNFPVSVGFVPVLGLWSTMSLCNKWKQRGELCLRTALRAISGTSGTTTRKISMSFDSLSSPHGQGWI